MNSTHTIPLPRLQSAMFHFVRGFGSDANEIEAVAGNLIEANLTGHDSHGIGMLPRYADAYLEGNLKPNRHVHTVLDAGALLRLDGQAGFGQVIGREAMALGIDRARHHGSCIVALGNSHHLGRIGAWAEQVAAAGLISMHFVNVISRPLVAPHGGGDARFGTNPFCAGVPIAGRDPVILDFATSMLAQGKTRVALNKGELVPADCLLDDHGQPTRDPCYAVLPPFGALLPFGGHKGSGLAMMCELLGGALASGMTQRDADTSRRRVLNGMFSVLLDPAALADRAAFEQEALEFLAWFQASPVRDGFDAVHIAGDPERACRIDRTANGVPVDVNTWREILQAAERLQLDATEIDRLAGVTAR